MTLSDLIPPDPPPAPDIVGCWDDLAFVMGGNDQPNVGDCVLVACANRKLIRTGQAMDDGEVENAYSQITKWSPLRPETNHGARVTDVLDFWRDKGWPADPLDKIGGYAEIGWGDVHTAIAGLGPCLGWAMLPQDSEGYVFTDDAMTRGLEGVAAHCVAIIGSVRSRGMTRIVTWANGVEVSLAWWRRYGKQAFAIKG